MLMPQSSRRRWTAVQDPSHVRLIAAETPSSVSETTTRRSSSSAPRKSRKREDAMTLCCTAEGASAMGVSAARALVHSVLMLSRSFSRGVVGCGGCTMAETTALSGAACCCGSGCGESAASSSDDGAAAAATAGVASGLLVLVSGSVFEGNSRGATEDEARARDAVVSTATLRACGRVVSAEAACTGSDLRVEAGEGTATLDAGTALLRPCEGRGGELAGAEAGDPVTNATEERYKLIARRMSFVAAATRFLWLFRASSPSFCGSIDPLLCLISSCPIVRCPS